jgi:hypothetical protein
MNLRLNPDQCPRDILLLIVCCYAYWKLEVHLTERLEIMSKFVATTFTSEANAYEGTRALKELHA